MPNTLYYETEDYIGHLHKNFNMAQPVYNPDVSEEKQEGKTE